MKQTFPKRNTNKKLPTQDHYQHSSCNPLVDLKKTTTDHCNHGEVVLNFQSKTRHPKTHEMFL